MKTTPVIVAVVAAAFAGPVSAQAAEQLARDRDCMSCHDVSQYKIAPPFKAVALKFRGNPDMALPRFTAALRDGIGHPKAEMTEDEIAKVTRWIMSL